jgi:hypothetical protein
LTCGSGKKIYDEVTMNIPEEIEKLKNMLQTEEEFGDIFQQFMVLVDSPKFMDMGKFKKNKLLDTVIKKTMSDIDMPNVMAIKIRYIRKFNFYHGSFIANFMPGNIIFFEDITMGLVSIPRDWEGNNSYFRFTGAFVGPGSFTSVKKSEETH